MVLADRTSLLGQLLDEAWLRFRRRMLSTSAMRYRRGGTAAPADHAAGSARRRPGDRAGNLFRRVSFRRQVDQCRRRKSVSPAGAKPAMAAGTAFFRLAAASGRGQGTAGGKQCPGAGPRLGGKLSATAPLADLGGGDDGAAADRLAVPFDPHPRPDRHQVLPRLSALDRHACAPPALRCADDRGGRARLLVQVALSYAGLCVQTPRNAIRAALRNLDAELASQILPDGGHVSRNEASLPEIVALLLPLRQSIARLGREPSREMISAIDRIMPAIRFHRMGDGNFARMNGMSETPRDLVMTVLRHDDTGAQIPDEAPYSGYQRLAAGETIVVADAGRPPVRRTVNARPCRLPVVRDVVWRRADRHQLRRAGQRRRSGRIRRPHDAGALNRDPERCLELPLRHERHRRRDVVETHHWRTAPRRRAP